MQKGFYIIILLPLLTAALFAANLFVGAADIPPADVLSILFGRGGDFAPSPFKPVLA